MIYPRLSVSPVCDVWFNLQDLRFFPILKRVNFLIFPKRINPLARNFISELRNKDNTDFAKFPFGVIQESRVQGISVYIIV
jgi:hypothetical protein